jgi:hypothetical protein
MADPILGQAQGLNKNLSDLVQVMRDRFALSAYTGSFTWSAAATKNVSDANVKANSLIFLMATESTAAALEAGAGKPYVSSRAAGSFTAATANGSSAAGTEVYEYLIVNVG